MVLPLPILPLSMTVPAGIEDGSVVLSVTAGEEGLGDTGKTVEFGRAEVCFGVLTVAKDEMGVTGDGEGPDSGLEA